MHTHRHRGSPTSQKVSFEQLRRGAGMPLDDCLRMEARMVHRCVERVGSDFYSGVGALLISRSGDPSWSPASLTDVSGWVVVVVGWKGEGGAGAVQTKIGTACTSVLPKALQPASAGV